jgi:hypothetical protein
VDRVVHIRTGERGADAVQDGVQAVDGLALFLSVHQRPAIVTRAVGHDHVRIALVATVGHRRPVSDRYRKQGARRRLFSLPS